MAVDLYSDDRISCTADGVVIRGYYFPFGGAKRIPYSAIRRVAVQPLTGLSGRWRIWGTSDPRYWFNLDPQRPRKQTALILDTGSWVRPVITPDDPDTVARIIAERRSRTT